MWGIVNASEREPFVRALDAALLPVGFSRKRKTTEWKRDEDASCESWIHLNFGLSVINPSVGVRYAGLDAHVPPEIRINSAAFEMLSSLSGCIYDGRTRPEDLAHHVETYGLAAILNLQNRETTITRLMESLGPWPVFGWSARIRLLPILLAAQGRLKEAVQWLEHFEEEGLSRDQQLPRYSEFVAAFRRMHGT